MTLKPKTRLRCPVDVFRYQDYRAFLAAFYEAKKASGLSYRGFSRAAGLGAPNYLQLVITKKRNLTAPMAERFAETCGLGKEASAYFMVLVAFNQAKTSSERAECFRQLTGFRRYRQAQKLELDEAAYHSTWYLPAIREMVLSPLFKENAEWIAEQLRPQIKASDVKLAIETLLALKLLTRDAEGQLGHTARVLSTGPQTTGMHIANYHAQMMHRAEASMDEVPAAERDISSLTLCMGSAGLANLKSRIQEFRRDLLKLCETEVTPGQVVQVNFQLFPLTQDLNLTSRRVGANNKRSRSN